MTTPPPVCNCEFRLPGDRPCPVHGTLGKEAGEMLLGASTSVRELEAERDAYREALEDIANRPTVERNPDGEDQAAETMRLIASNALAKYRKGERQ